MSEPTSNQTAGKQGSGLAIAGLVLGIIAAVTSFLPIINNVSFFIGIIGGVLALVALVGALRGRHDAKGMSIAGVVLAVVSCVVVLASQSAYKAALDKAVDKATAGSRPVATSTKDDAEDDSAGSAGAGEAKDDATKKKSGKKATDDAGAKDDAEAAEAKDYSSLAVGEEVELEDGLSVVVNSVQTGLASYGDSLVTCVNVTYTNNGKESESFNSYDWKAEDANGAQRGTTFYMDGEDELSSGKLSAGGTVTGNIYFEDGVTRVLYYSNMFNSSATAGWVL